jgi:hypothetical protein
MIEFNRYLRHYLSRRYPSALGLINIIGISTDVASVAAGGFNYRTVIISILKVSASFSACILSMTKNSKPDLGRR